MSYGVVRACAACGERPARGLGQGYCRPCATARDKASARARRAELKALREEIRALRERLKKPPVAVPDVEC